ncbi:MAG: sulfatase-like hydrolase/transferase [Flavobacteriales bacterium]
MRTALLHFLKLAILWLAFFAVQRALFLAFAWRYAGQSNAAEIALSFRYGFAMDLSMTGYVLVVPALLVSALLFIERRWIRAALRIWLILMFVLCSAIVVADIGLFASWGTRINHKALSYLIYPDEAMAAAEGASVLWPSIALAAALLLVLGVLRRIRSRTAWNNGPLWARGGAAVLLPGLCILALRGGWQDYPINKSWAYYSSKQVLNLAAVNGPWNALEVLVVPAEYTANPYTYVAKEKAEAIVSNAYASHSDSAVRVLNTARPNIVLILLESWSGDVTGPIGGETDVSPEFTRLCKDGLLFTNFYSTGFRTEQGLCAVLSGFPSQPKTTIIRQFGKFDRLPSLVRTLDSAGYNSRYTYSGDVTFANTRTYLQAMGFDVIHDETSIPGKHRTRWGAYDEDLFAFAVDDMKGMREPFFNLIMTATSHEPFIAPVQSPFTGKREPDLYRNTIHYTDQWLGWFMEQAKSQPWYANTLFVIMPDHGHYLPKYRAQYAAERHHIPLLLLGPALRADLHGTANNTFGCHSDVSTTLLAQLGRLKKQNPWGKNLLDMSRQQFAYWSFDDGFGIADSDRTLVWDNVGQRYLQQVGDTTASTRKEELLLRGKAITQVLLDRYIGFNQ